MTFFIRSILGIFLTSIYIVNSQYIYAMQEETVETKKRKKHPSHSSSSSPDHKNPRKGGGSSHEEEEYEKSSHEEKKEESLIVQLPLQNAFKVIGDNDITLDLPSDNDKKFISDLYVNSSGDHYFAKAEDKPATPGEAYKQYTKFDLEDVEKFTKSGGIFPQNIIWVINHNFVPVGIVGLRVLGYPNFEGDADYNGMPEEEIGHFNIQPGDLSISILIDKEKQGQGLAPKALKVLFDKVIPLVKVKHERNAGAFYYTDFDASAKLMNKIPDSNMKQVGTFEKQNRTFSVFSNKGSNKIEHEEKLETHTTNDAK